MIEYDDGQPVGDSHDDTQRVGGRRRIEGRSRLDPRRLGQFRHRFGDRTQRRIAFALAIAAGLTVGVVSTQRQRDAQALRAERNTVILHATVDPGSAFPSPESRRIIVRLLNLGPLPIGIESVRVDAPGFEPTRDHRFSDRRLGAGKTTPIALEIGASQCAPGGDEAVSAGNPVVTAGIRTSGGEYTELRQELMDTQLIALYQSECGGYGQEGYLDSPVDWTLVTVRGNPTLRGNGVLHAGQVAIRVVAIEGTGTFAARLRGRPVDIPARSQGTVPLEITVAECTGTLTELDPSVASFRLETASDGGLIEVYTGFTDHTLFALSDLYVRSCPNATP